MLRSSVMRLGEADGGWCQDADRPQRPPALKWYAPSIRVSGTFVVDPQGPDRCAACSSWAASRLAADDLRAQKMTLIHVWPGTRIAV